MRATCLGLLAVAACGGGDDSGAIDAPRAIDAPTIDAHPCYAPADWGAATLTAPTAHVDDLAAPTYADLQGPIQGTDDTFTIELWQDRGAFAGVTPQPGTYPLEGDDTIYGACGACVRVYLDGDYANYPAGSPYMAISGSITIDTITPDFTGSVTALVLRHGNYFAEDECVSAIGPLSFTATATMN